MAAYAIATYIISLQHTTVVVIDHIATHKSFIAIISIAKEKYLNAI
jgi:hypothetical protein